MSEDAQMLQPVLLLQLVGITHAAAPVNRLPLVTHDALDRLHIHISSACGAKVVHHLCMLRCDVFLPQTPEHKLYCISVPLALAKISEGVQLSAYEFHEADRS